MKISAIIFFFGLAFLVELIGTTLQNQTLQFIGKPLLLASLAIYFFQQTRSERNGIKKWIFAALIFSWVGDVLLLFQQNNSIFFLLGLSAFLLAHVFYIICFHVIRMKENIKPNAWLLLIVVSYYAVLIALLSPHLGDMKLPVRIYGIVISFMFMLAMHLLYMHYKTPARWIFWGALLFVISDSLLAIDKFYQAFKPAGLLIMLSYGLAQLFIINGLVRYTRSAISN